ncbi:MAG: DUF177 domain-containing protein [Acidimicrobiia bacterium]|nr:DUF177 domain-containing protein [Acidimicrobiia bacterium]
MPTRGSVLRVGITELRRRPGTQRLVVLRTAIPGLAVTSARVPDDADLAIDLTLESVEGTAITARGTVGVPWVADCRRCLDVVSGTLVVEVREVYEAHPRDGETYPIEVDEIDLEPVVRDAVLLNLPISPLCRSDCEGPVPHDLPVTGPGELPEDERDDAPPKDPRWAALDDLNFDPS